ncbi:unnamed protein product [Withania somnifera]
MDSYSYVSISSSNNNSSNSTYPQEVKKNKALPSYHSSLHGVRRLPIKPMTKQPIAPLPPTPPKIYKVEPVNFKEVVQMLTSAPEFQSVSNSSISNIAPPPLDLSPVSLQRNNNNNNNIATQWREFLHSSSSTNNQVVELISATYNESINDTQEKLHITHRIPSENNFGLCSPLANFPLSPASFAWCSSILFSPGTTLTSPSAVQII